MGVKADYSDFKSNLYKRLVEIEDDLCYKILLSSNYQELIKILADHLEELKSVYAGGEV